MTTDSNTRVHAPGELAHMFRVSTGFSEAEALAAAKQFAAHISLRAQGVPHDDAAHRARWMTDPAYFWQLMEEAAAEALAREDLEAAQAAALSS